MTSATPQGGSSKKDNGISDEEKAVEEFIDKLFEFGWIGRIQHRALTVGSPKWGAPWTDEQFKVAGQAIVRLHNKGNADDFLKEARAALPESHADVKPIGGIVTFIVGEDVSKWIAAAFYILVAARDNPALLDRI